MTAFKAVNMARLPKHREVSRQLRADIAAGRYAAGARMPGEPQLARRFKVSRPTIARALLDLHRESLIHRRAGSGTYVSVAGRGIQAPARIVGLLIPGLGATEIFEIISGEIAGLARAHDFSLLWGGSARPRDGGDISFEQAEKICAQFVEQRLSGVFFAPFELIPDREQANRRLAEGLRRAGIPVVLLDRDLGPFPKRSDFDLVGLDNMAAGYLLAEHFLRLGCRRLAFVARPHSASTVDARIAGAREALARHRVELRPDWIRIGAPADLKFARRLVGGREWDALLCANDHTAAELLRSLAQSGVRVPADVRIAGFDDVQYATLLSPALTTVHQPCREIAAAAFRALLDRIADPTLPARSHLLTPSLVVRESCGAYLSAGFGRGAGNPTIAPPMKRRNAPKKG